MKLKVKRKNRISIDLRSIFYFLIIFPFFHLQSISELAEIDRAWFAIDRILLGLKICISVSIILLNVNRRKTYSSVIWIIFYTFLLAITSFANNSFSFNYFLSSIMPIAGFAILCKEFLNKNQDKFIESAYRLFAFLSICGALSIYIFPNGFYNAPTKAGAIYLLGRKNASFFYYFIYVFLGRYRKLVKGKDISTINYFVYVFLLISLTICDCISGVILLSLCIIYVFTDRKKSRLMELFTPRIMFIIFAIFAVLIPTVLVGARLNFLTFFNRSSSFSGRDFLWMQAIELIKKHPLLGNGINVSFSLNNSLSTIANQAHNIYLDIGVRYGLITLMFFLVMIYVVFYKLHEGNNKQVTRNAAFFLWILLIHSIFDYVSDYLLFFVIMICLHYCSTTNPDDKSEQKTN